MTTLENIKEKFQQGESKAGSGYLKQMERSAFSDFNKLGIPTARHEEWKYTRVGGLFNKEYTFQPEAQLSISASDVEGLRLPGYEEANEIV